MNKTPKRIKATKSRSLLPLLNPKLRQAQLSELKQGLTEAILISRGDMQGIPLSELWDE